MADWHTSRDATSAFQVARHNRMYDEVMLTFARDVLALTEAVAAGPVAWRRRFVDTMHAAGFPLANDEIADRVYAFLCLRVQQLAHSDVPAQQAARHYLDHLDMDSTPAIPTEQEIAESWELESASSPDGQAFAYGGKTKDDVMRGLAGALDPTFTHEDDGA